MQYRYTIYDLTVPEIPKIARVDEWIRALFSTWNITIKDSVSTIFPNSDLAYTIAYVLSESHAVIHTSPETNWVEVIFAFCTDVDPYKMEAAVTSFFEPTKVRITNLVGEPPREKRSLT